MVNLAHDFEVFPGKEPVSLGIALRFDETAELVRPETHQRDILPENVRHLTDSVEVFLVPFFHCNISIH